MNWQLALQRKLFDSRSEEELKAELLRTLPRFRAPQNLRRWLAQAARLRRAALQRTGQPPDNPATDSYESMKMVFAAELSEREGRIVPLADL